MQRTTDQCHMLHILPVNPMSNVALNQLRIHQRGYFIHHFLQIKWNLFQYCLLRLQFTHIQHIIDQLLQMLGRQLNLIQTLFQLLWIIAVLTGNIYHSHNSIDRCTNIMAHPIQKVRLGLTD